MLIYRKQNRDVTSLRSLFKVPQLLAHQCRTQTRTLTWRLVLFPDTRSSLTSVDACGAHHLCPGHWSQSQWPCYPCSAGSLLPWFPPLEPDQKEREHLQQLLFHKVLFWVFQILPGRVGIIILTVVLQKLQSVLLSEQGQIQATEDGQALFMAPSFGTFLKNPGPWWGGPSVGSSPCFHVSQV